MYSYVKTCSYLLVLALFTTMNSYGANDSSGITPVTNPQVNTLCLNVTVGSALLSSTPTVFTSTYDASQCVAGTNPGTVVYAGTPVAGGLAGDIQANCTDPAYPYLVKFSDYWVMAALGGTADLEQSLCCPVAGSGPNQQLLVDNKWLAGTTSDCP